MIKSDLRDGWTVRAAGGPVPAEMGDSRLTAVVPGTIHTDLLAAGLIPDPYAGTNEVDLAWLHRSSWLYERSLSVAPAAPGERVDLVFDGLDTVATVSLGGVELGSTANMHRSYRFDVRELAGPQDQTLRVRFDSALEYAEAVQEKLGARPHANTHPFNAVRKMACSFGWDWGPDLQTAGIWKPVRLERWRVARLAGVRPLATLEGGTGRLSVHVDVERSGLEEAGELGVRVTAAGVTAESTIEGVTPAPTADAVTPAPTADAVSAELGARGVAAGSASRVVELEVPDAPVWWPAGHGEQPLVPVTVELLAADGSVLDAYECRVGFRSVVLDETDSRFTLVVNGREIFVLGLNWIPEDHLLTRLTRPDYVAAVDRAVAVGANLLRVWGGGIYESDDFYEVCDERGIMVWQDFLLACAAYAEEDPLRGEILAEARENVTRLSSHPALVIWNGGNENIWGHEDWGWKSRLGERSWGARYYYEDFPALLAELDPSRPYHPGSPSSPGFDPEVVHPNDPAHGTRHEWEAWNREDYTWHDQFTPRFMSEFGWQAPPAWSTLTEALAPEDLSQESTAFLLHQKAEDGNGKLNRGLAHHLVVPADFGQWHWATQLNQARATRHAVVHLRSHAPYTMGSILWQLNDCWPVTSWAVVDGAGRLKPSWYALRQAYRPRMLAFRGSSLVAVNDTSASWTGEVSVRRLTFEGTVLESSTVSLDVAPRSVAVLSPGTADPSDASGEVVVADFEGLRATRLFAEDYDLAWAAAPVTATAAPIEGGYAVTVTATSFARDVALLADRVAPDAVVDDMLVDLLPGETHTFTVRTAAAADPGAFTDPLVLRSANAIR
jgi:beta-mannosidase